MKKIYVCLRFHNDDKKCEQLARVYCRMVWDKGHFPVNTNLYLPLFLDTRDKTESGTIKRISALAIEQCAELWVFGKYITRDMSAEIELAKAANIPVKYFNQYGEPENFS